MVATITKMAASPLMALVASLVLTALASPISHNEQFIQRVNMIDPHCNNFTFKTMCQAADTPGDCQWCNLSQPDGNQCISKADQCKTKNVPEVAYALGVRPYHFDQEIRQILEEAQHEPISEEQVVEEATIVGSSLPQVLEGFYVRPCANAGFSSDGQPISTFDTRYYDNKRNGHYYYELDRTYYIGDEDCTPSQSKIFFKLNIHGEITYHGANPTKNLGYQAQMNWTNATLFISKQYSSRVIDELSDCCKDVDWKTDTWFTVDGRNCSASASDSQLCNLASGSVDTFNFNVTDSLHYITSRDDFNPILGWNNPLIPGYVREKIPQSGNNNPKDCDHVLWGECGEAIKQAASDCASCGYDSDGPSNLECEGCVFRVLNPLSGPNKWDPNSMDNRWHTCCPCVAEYAENVRPTGWLAHAIDHC